MGVAQRFGMVLAAAVLLCGLALLSPGGATAQSVSIEPGAAVAGATVTASGSGWSPGIYVRVEWADGTLLGEVQVEADGAFDVFIGIPTTATPATYQIRFVGYVPPYVVDCTVTTVQVPLTVVPAGTTVTPETATSTSTATETATETESTTATAVATVCGTATEDATGTTTAVATETATETATSTATATSTNTPSPTATATATRTPTKVPTKVPTRTPTKVTYPGTGSGGLLDQNDGDGGSSMPLIIAAIILGTGLASAGAVVVRRRIV